MAYGATIQACLLLDRVEQQAVRLVDPAGVQWAACGQGQGCAGQVAVAVAVAGCSGCQDPLPSGRGALSPVAKHSRNTVVAEVRRRRPVNETCSSSLSAAFSRAATCRKIDWPIADASLRRVERSPTFAGRMLGVVVPKGLEQRGIEGVKGTLFVRSA